MDTTHLREFVVVAELLNYSEAARQLFISPATLTRHICALEDTLGVQLLERNSRYVRLTPAGQILRQELDVLLPQLDGLHARVCRSNILTS
ncbi:MAG: LysR family transcriptional regulator [Coriobacteriales bacterium]|jgi:DNA-binding transcriptional LysR family regulator|nr:LysR family transcriptional regulator [Coriobacteriales bacterium]